MDTTFIKMCDCPEIQEPKRESGVFVGDYVATPKGQVEIIQGNPSYKYGLMTVIWLPTQEQLQDMVIPPEEKNSEGKYIVLLHDFLEWVLDDCTGWASKPSIDQLWVAFVMHELHQKCWTENGWEMIKQEVSNEKS